MIDQILFFLLVGSEKPCIFGFPNLYGPYVDTVGKNTAAIKSYIQNQIKEDLEYDQMTLVEYIDPFTGEPVKKNKK